MFIYWLKCDLKCCFKSILFARNLCPEKFLVAPLVHATTINLGIVLKKITMKQFDFGEASNFQSATVLKITFLQDFFENFRQDIQKAFKYNITQL